MGVVIPKPWNKRNTYVRFSEQLSSSWFKAITPVSSKCFSPNPLFCLKGSREGEVEGTAANRQTINVRTGRLFKSTLGFHSNTKCNCFTLMMLILPIKCWLRCSNINWGEGGTYNVDLSVHTEFLKRFEWAHYPVAHRGEQSVWKTGGWGKKTTTQKARFWRFTKAGLYGHPPTFKKKCLHVLFLC